MNTDLAVDERIKEKGMVLTLSKDGLEVTRVQRKQKFIRDFIDLSQGDDKSEGFGTSRGEPVQRSKSGQ